MILPRLTDLILGQYGVKTSYVAVPVAINYTGLDYLAWSGIEPYIENHLAGFAHFAVLVEAMLLFSYISDQDGKCMQIYLAYFEPVYLGLTTCWLSPPPPATLWPIYVGCCTS